MNSSIHENAFSNNTELEEMFGSDWIDITEKLYKSIFYYNRKNFSLSILSFSQFYEYFLEKIIPVILPIEIYGKTNAQNAEQYFNFNGLFEEYYADYLRKRPEFKPKIESVNSGIMVVKALTKGSAKDFTKMISPYIDFTDDCIYGKALLNVTRNQIAHQGKFISESDISKKLSYYPNLLSRTAEIFQLTRADLFSDLGDLLENNLRN
ncbi:MAG: hypothetical protein LC107_08195 [Chitinophagales bacterium]|nr:hypothetical protein [Chitinophagales bacterium]